MNRNDIEFKEGDEVTFNAYGIPLKAIVKVVDCRHISFSNEPDERIFYEIRGRDIISKCTGKSIQESKYFEKPEIDIIPGQSEIFK